MRLRAGRRELELGGPPLLMGVVNASPDSFSDAGDHPDLPARAAELVAAGAAVLDVGGESAVGGRPPVAVAEEIERVVPLVGRIAAAHDVLISVDTYKPEVAEAAIEAGAGMINDVSGLRDERLAEVCARTGAALVLMHTRVAPKGTLLRPDAYDDVVEDVVGFLRERMEVAVGAGVAPEQIVLDPGPDFAKTPAQTVAVLRRLDLLTRARPTAAAGGLAQGLPRRHHRPRAARARGGDARRARLRRPRGGGDPARPRRRRGRRLPRGALGAVGRASSCTGRRSDA